MHFSMTEHTEVFEDFVKKGFALVTCLRMKAIKNAFTVNICDPD